MNRKSASKRPYTTHRGGWLARRQAERSPGQIIIILAIAMVPLLASVGLAVDLGIVVLHHRQLQNGVDAAAHAGMQKIATGIPNGVAPWGYTYADVQGVLNQYVDANVSTYNIVLADLVWGSGADADMCLTTEIRRVALVSAFWPDDLYTADCLQVIATHDYTTVAARVLPGLQTMRVSARGTAAATPVTAMSNLMPMAVSDGSWTNIDGVLKTPWSSQWNQENLQIKTCTAWSQMNVPHPLMPSQGSNGNCGASDGDNGINTINYKGLLNFSGPQMGAAGGPAVTTNPNPSTATACRWDNQHTGGGPPPPETKGSSGNDKHSGPPNDAQQITVDWRGFNNPPGPTAFGSPATIDHDKGSRTGTAMSHPAWNNSTYRPPYITANMPDANRCDDQSNTQKWAVEQWIKYGFNGIINTGNAAVGQGDFFMLIGGNLGATISTPVNQGPCNGVSTAVLTVPLFDAFADPTNSLGWTPGNNPPAEASLHLSKFAGFGVTCPVGSPSSNVGGTFIQATVSSGAITGGHRQVGVPNITTIQFVG